MKIYLSPSNQPNNKYAYGNTNEKAQMERLAISLRDKLSAYECTPILATLSLPYTARDEEAQAKGANLYIAIHSDAGPATAIGATAFYTPATVELAELMIKELNAICPYPENRADQTKDGIAAGFGEIWGPKTKGIPVILVETNFHTNANVAKWMIENIDKLAEAYCKAIVIKYGLKLKAVPQTSAPTQGKKSIEEVAKEVIQGIWGNGNERKQRLTDAGYNPKTVQAKVNQLVNSKSGVTPVAPAPAPQPVTNSYEVRVTAGLLNYRKGPGAGYGINGTVKRNEVYTIVEVKNGWGRLKSGSGWINLDYTTKHS